MSNMQVSSWYGEPRTGRPKVGILSVSWCGVPPRRLGSVAKVVHETSRLLVDRYALTIVGGANSRDAEKELKEITYNVVSDKLDKVFTHRWVSLIEMIRGLNRHQLHRETYRPIYARRAAEVFRAAGSRIVIVHQCPQWLPVLRRRLPDTTLLFWGHAATHVEEKGGLRDQLAHADAAIGCSQYVARRMEEQVPTLTGRVYTVYNGLDPEEFCPDPTVERAQRTLFYVGRVTPEKGVHVLVDAFRLLVPRYPDLELIIAGPQWVSDISLLPGTDRQHLEEIRRIPKDYKNELLRRAGEYADRVRITGPVPHDELVASYRSCTIFIQPALWEEGFGIPVVEAMASGAPVVISNRGGMPELVEPGKTGFVVPSGDRRALADRLDHLLANPDLRRELGQQAAAIAPKRFSWRQSAKAMAGVLDRFTLPADAADSMEAR